MQQNQNTSVDQIWVLGHWDLFQGKQTFQTSTFLSDSDKMLAFLPFFSETGRLFHKWLLHWRRNCPHVERGQIFLLLCPVFCDNSLRARWWPGPASGLSHPRGIATTMLSQGWKQPWGSPSHLLLRKHSIIRLSFLTYLALLPFFPPCWQRNLNFPGVTLTYSLPTATQSWFISSTSCSPLGVSKEQLFLGTPTTPQKTNQALFCLPIAQQSPFHITPALFHTLPCYQKTI